VSLAARLFLEALRFDLEPEDAVRRRVERALELGVGGFVVFGGEAELVAARVAEWRDSVRHRLWIASDLERGPGQQFAGLPELPPPAGLAACPDPLATARSAGRITGRGARSVGVDLVLAPVLDLDVDPRNPIVGTRSFGSRPDDVSRLGREWIEACESAGAGACAKHFPGHGRTTTDSHDELPVVDAGRAELEEDLEPFRAVADTVSAVMTAHVAYPSLGSSRPATLEPHLLIDLLREEMGFEGLVVTDALNMSGFTDAVASTGPDAGPAAGAVAALLAGCDLLLYPADLAASAAALDRAALADARTGDRLEESLRRLERTARRIRAGAPDDLEDSVRNTRRDFDEAERIAVSSVEIVGERPWRIRPAIPVRLEAVWDDRPAPDRPPLGSIFAAELRRQGWTVLEDDGGTEDGESPATLLLVASTPQAWKGTSSFTAAGRSRLDSIMASCSNAWPIVFGHPRLLTEIRPDGAGMCAWGTEQRMERSAAARLDAEVRRADGGSTGAIYA
jgi:beta-glucosidase-like glycosyl hydrolase